MHGLLLAQKPMIVGEHTNNDKTTHMPKHWKGTQLVMCLIRMSFTFIECNQGY